MTRKPTIPNFWSFVKSTGYPINSIVQISTDSDKGVLQTHFRDSNFYVFDRNASEPEVVNENYLGLKCEFFSSLLSAETGSKKQAIKLNHSGVWEFSGSKDKKSDLEFCEVQNVGKLVLSRKISGNSILTMSDYKEVEIVLQGNKAQFNVFSFISLSIAMSSFPVVIKEMSEAGFQVFDVCSPCYYFDVLAKIDLVFINTNLMEYSLFNPQSRGGFDVENWHEYSCN